MPARRIGLLATAAVVLVAVVWGLLQSTARRADRGRVYRIGYGRDVPFHFQGRDGRPTGLAVELVKEAARRRGFRLEWVDGEGLVADQLDLWVLMTLRPEPRPDIHLTEPFLQTHTCFLVPESSTVREPADLRRARVSFIDFAVHRRNVTRLVPEVQPFPVKSSEAALRAVVAGQADAAYLDEYAALPALLSGAAGSMPMRTLPARLPKSEMGLAAQLPFARVADEIRDEMHAMERDGSLLRLVEDWGFFPNLTADEIAGVAGIRERERWLTAGVAVLTLLSGVALSLAVRSRRQALRLERTQARLRESERQLRQAQKMEAIGQLAGGVAHDFNNILAATLLNVDLLESTPGLDPAVREGLAEIGANARRATHLTRQLLMFSRRSVLEARALDLNQLVDSLLRMLGRLLGEHLRIEFERSPDAPRIEADGALLEQVLVNLAVNARDAMPDGGVIRISTGIREFAPGETSTHPSRRTGRFATIAVADSGTGMSEATLAHVFEPFFTTKPPGKGTGLGLATVHGIVAQHRGWVEVQSTLGRGSTFTLYLPLASHPPHDPASKPAPQIPRGRETVLVVEDDPDVRRPLVRMLSDLGYRVLEAENGPEALARGRQPDGRPDLLLTDMVLPLGMNGRALAEAFRAERPQLPVIISSGFSSDIVDAGLPTDRGIGYLPKPYTREELATLVRALLEGRPPPPASRPRA